MNVGLKINEQIESDRDKVCRCIWSVLDSWLTCKFERLETVLAVGLGGVDRVCCFGHVMGPG